MSDNADGLIVAGIPAQYDSELYDHDTLLIDLTAMDLARTDIKVGTVLRSSRDGSIYEVVRLDHHRQGWDVDGCTAVARKRFAAAPTTDA